MVGIRTDLMKFDSVCSISPKGNLEMLTNRGKLISKHILIEESVNIVSADTFSSTIDRCYNESELANLQRDKIKS